MKINKVVKFLIVLLSILMLSAPIYAFSLANIKETGDNFTNNGNVQISEEKLARDVIAPIAGALTAIGSVVIVGFGIVLGIKFITGGAEDQAKCKQQAVGLVVSAIVIWGAYGIWSGVYMILNNNLK